MTDQTPEARLAAALRKLLMANGVDHTSNQGYHRWRCEHPDRYGPCDCFDEMVRDVAIGALADLADDGYTIVSQADADRMAEALRYEASVNGITTHGLEALRQHDTLVSEPSTPQKTKRMPVALAPGQFDHDREDRP